MEGNTVKTMYIALYDYDYVASIPAMSRDEAFNKATVRIKKELGTFRPEMLKVITEEENRRNAR